ncbi:MAG: acyl-CoA dehydrogenase family protein [Flavobacteriaceae bacterium]
MVQANEKLIEAARELAETYLRDNAQRIDTQELFPREGLQKMAAAGLCGMTIPKEYGGHDVNATTMCKIMEALAYGCPSTAGVLMAYVIGIQPLVAYGTPEQKKAYLPKLATAESSCCLALTEAHAGSDLATIRMTARREGDEYVLNGKKVLIGNVVGSDVCLVVAKTDPDAGHKGISMFVVRNPTPGYTVSHVYTKLGMRGTTTGEITFDNVRVPASAMVGKEGAGLKHALSVLDLARLALAAECVGLAQAALEEAVSYANERVAFGQAIAGHQGIQFMIADMATKIHAARVMLYDAAAKCDAGKAYSTEASMVKLFASEMCNDVASKGLQINGGAGLVDNPRAQQLFRDARYTIMWEGTSEIQRVIISRATIAAGGKTPKL